MYFTTKHHQIALTLLAGVGSKRARTILNHFSNLEEFFSEKRINLAKLPGISATALTVKQRLDALIEADKIVELIAKDGVNTIFLNEVSYPNRLKQCADAPLLLYSKGNIEWNAKKIISIVGTRNASNYGKVLVKELVHGVAAHDAIVVSGMAYGIDVFAHQEALKNELSTWGVLGHGIGWMYPTEHKKIANQMLERGGLISEFIPRLKPEPPFFPMRNRIVAGLTDATIVVESGEKGGSLITADLANDYNREVYAYPGDVTRTTSLGCLSLIANNKATLVRNSKDVLDNLGWLTRNTKKISQPTLFEQVNEQELKIIEVMKEKKNNSLEAICFLSSLAVNEVVTLLLSLEFKGLVQSKPGNRFELIC